MHFIYIDEAGTSAEEPTCVVVGILVNADTQWRKAEERIARILDIVPDVFRTDFIFHAKTIWGSKKYRDIWSLSDRLAVLHGMMSIPRELNMPIAVGMINNTVRTAYKEEYGNSPFRISKKEFQHMTVFLECIQSADAYIMKHMPQNEVAVPVAEDIPQRRSFLRSLLSGMRADSRAAEMGVAVYRIVDTIHFVEKRNAPLLQIADACAFGLRRMVAGQSFGMEFSGSIVGPNIEDWETMRSYGDSGLVIHWKKETP